MTEIRIREAKKSDSPDIARLVTQLGYPTSESEMKDRLTVLLPRPEYVIFVAESSGRMIGLIGAYLGYALEFDGTYGRLTGVVVDASFRASGVGKMLLERIESWLRKKGVRMVTLTSGKHRKAAHGFYRHLGYEETGLRFSKSL
jgi:GNAT superfamily N-acetyltransferase